MNYDHRNDALRYALMGGFAGHFNIKKKGGEDKLGEKIAVHCKTKEEWEGVREKMGYPVKLCAWGAVSASENNKDDLCIYIPGAGFDHKTHALRNGYTIIPASEYLGEFQVGDRVECISIDEINGSVWNHASLGEIYTVKRVNNDSLALDGYGGCPKKKRFKKISTNQPKTTKKEASIMSEANVKIGSIFLEVFSNGKQAKKMSDRFGDQYGNNPDRDLIALENDKDKLVKILKDEDAEEAKAAKNK